MIDGLRKAGFQAFLVGGGVRDLLLGGQPKDFDISTDARPEDVRALFRRSRIIGRRFKIVHVCYKRDIVEVTTFRGEHPGEAVANEAGQSLSGLAAARSEHGMLLRDNVYGTLQEDVGRRDFTVNALYYNVTDATIHDYTGGMADLRDKVLRIIGDPEQRYREDPVRLLRAVRFAAKLGFSLATNTVEPLTDLASMLSVIAPARLFDEVLKLLLCGHAVATYTLLQQYGLFAVLFPQTAACLTADPSPPPWHGEPLLLAALHSTDRRIHAGLPVTPAFLFAALLWPALQAPFVQLQAAGEAALPALEQAAHQLLFVQRQSTAIPRRFAAPMVEIWSLQLSLAQRHGQRAERLHSHRRFRAAFDFLLLREAVGEQTGGLGLWWEHYQRVTPAQRAQAVRDLPPRRGRSAPAHSSVDKQADDV